MKTLKQIVLMLAAASALAMGANANAGVFDGYPNTQNEFDSHFPHRMMMIEKMKPESQKKAMEMMAKMEQMKNTHQMEMMTMEMTHQKAMMEMRQKFIDFLYSGN